MKIRDSHAILNGDKTTYTLPSDGLEIISDDGKTLFQIRLEKGAIISVWSGDYCRHEGKVFEDRFLMRPHSSNVVDFLKVEHQA